MYGPYRRNTKICGLVGIIGDIWNVDKKAFEYMLSLDTVRGPHSTGTARVYANNRPNVGIVKGVGTPWDLRGSNPDVYYGGNKHEVIDGNLMCLMGHNRWATVGAVNADNAHPFEAGNIVGMHNGTLPDHWRKKLEDWDKYGTDSEAIMANINQFGVENVIPTIDGAWTLTWYDKERDSFNVLRNNQRPLWFAWKKNGRVLFYASEYWMIYQAAERFGIELENELAYAFNSDVHYEFKMPKAIGTFGKNCVEEKPLKGWTPPPYKRSYTSNVTYLRGNAEKSANVFLLEDKSNEPSPSSFEYWAAKRDKFFEFTVDGSTPKDSAGIEYIKGLTNDGVEVRIYAPSPAIKADLSDPSILTYAAKVKKVKRVGENFYVTIDYSTFMTAMAKDGIQIPDPNEELRKHIDELFGNKTPDVIYANGTYVDEKGFYSLTRKGCCWCSDTPMLSDAANIHWLNAGEFLCADCAKDTSTMEYVAAYAN